MNRIPIAALAVVVALSVAGCTTGLQDEPDTTSEVSTGDGQFTAEVVPEAPPNATAVNYSDDRVQANEYLRTAVSEAVNGSGSAVVTVPARNVEETKADIGSLPLYTLEEVSGEYDWGHYVEYEGTAVRVVFAVLD
ncbi:hypothetical protein [Halorussus amylolyticus]|uniref:hypothetical protein n=1 Tax=Halorussus amylolyticus TaxID=1126242 RepID=UPI00104CFA1F|nr:hypothetical protein [Halorussus amylolyticus]